MLAAENVAVAGHNLKVPSRRRHPVSATWLPAQITRWWRGPTIIDPPNSTGSGQTLPVPAPHEHVRSTSVSYRNRCSAGNEQFVPKPELGCSRPQQTVLQSGPFGCLPAHEPVTVDRGYDNLTHSVVGIFGLRADRPTRSKFSV
jgi:hypothetical protein